VLFGFSCTVGVCAAVAAPGEELGLGRGAPDGRGLGLGRGRELGRGAPDELELELGRGASDLGLGRGRGASAEELGRPDEGLGVVGWGRDAGVCDSMKFARSSAKAA